VILWFVIRDFVPVHSEVRRSITNHQSRITHGTCLAALFVAAMARAAAAQDGADIAFGYEHRLDRIVYRFENDSSFDTPELVPHFFRQQYTADNDWGLLRVRFGVRHTRWETQVGLTPQVTARGDDFDTFFQPGGDVVVSGTTGNVSMRSLRLDQRVDAHTGSRLRTYVSYGYRRDRAEFHLGHKSVTHTSPPSVERSIVTTRETTSSDVHEIRFGLDVRTSGLPWRITWNLEGSPATLARLMVRLPDKYPDRDLRFWARALSAGTALGVERACGPLVLELRAGYARSWSPGSAARFERHGAQATVRVTFVIHDS
jgi:hypothetical protein